MEWAASTSMFILRDALQEQGYQVTLYENSTRMSFIHPSTYVRGEFDKTAAKMILLNAQAGTEGQMKVSYSKKVVEGQAKRFGWGAVEWKTNTAGNPVATLKRRA